MGLLKIKKIVLEGNDDTVIDFDSPQATRDFCLNYLGSHSGIMLAHDADSITYEPTAHPGKKLVIKDRRNPEAGWVTEYAVCARCGSDVGDPNTDDPCKCPDPVPTRDNAVIEILDEVMNYRNAYKTILERVMGRSMSDYIGLYLSDAEFCEPAVVEAPMDLTYLDAMYVSLRAVIAARKSQRDLKQKLIGEAKDFASAFDLAMRSYLEYLATNEIITAIEMSWEDKENGVYEVVVQSTPVPERWHVRLFTREQDIAKFATARYWSPERMNEEYTPFLLLFRFDEDVEDNGAGEWGT